MKKKPNQFWQKIWIQFVRLLQLYSQSCFLDKSCSLDLITNSEFHVMKILTNQNDSCLFIKGQEISEWNCGVLNFPENKRKDLLNFCLYFFLIQPLFRCYGRNQGFKKKLLGKIETPQFHIEISWHLVLDIFFAKHE